MTVVAPSDPWQAHELTRQLYARGGPAYLRIDKGIAGLPSGRVELGKLRQARDGEDVVIFATGGILCEAIAAADALAPEGISVRVIDVHTIKPLDVEGVFEAVRACGHVITLEEHVVAGGLGGLIAETCAEAQVAHKSFQRLGLGDEFPDVVGDQAYLRARFGLNADSVAGSVKRALAN
jgi:transketolase